jgi:hypothetical protein
VNALQLVLPLRRVFRVELEKGRRRSPFYADRPRRHC